LRWVAEVGGFEPFVERLAARADLRVGFNALSGRRAAASRPRREWGASGNKKRCIVWLGALKALGSCG
jgi:hypothetical protein